MADSTTSQLPFHLGDLCATPGAVDAAGEAGVRLVDFVLRHLGADWGNLDAEDWAANDHAVANGERILSSYPLGTGQDIWVITDADRSVTTILLASEY